MAGIVDRAVALLTRTGPVHNRGRARDPAPVTRRLRLAAMLAPLLTAVVGLFAAGLLVVLLQSLGWLQPAGVGAPAPPTAQAYLGLFADREFYLSLTLTLWVATVTTVLSLAGGVAIALGLHRLVRGRRIAYSLLQVPLAVPHLAMAVAMLNLIAPSGLVARAAYAIGWIAGPADFPALVHDRYGAGIVLAYAAKEIPFMAVVATAMLLRLGDDYDALARTLGASARQRLRHVTLPLIAPGVGAAALIVFAYVFAAFETPFLLGRPYPAMLSVVAERQFVSVDLAERPTAMAYALVMTVLAAIVVRGYLALSQAMSGRERPVVF
jgi:putative spermidine/putrescine transport system permease protein